MRNVVVAALGCGALACAPASSPGTRDDAAAAGQPSGGTAGSAVAGAAGAAEPAPEMPLPPDVPALTLDEVIGDMVGSHEGFMHGVPSGYNWAKGPRIGMGNDPRGWTAATAWGQLYEDARGNPAVNARVEIADLRTYVLSKRDGRWRVLQEGMRPKGAAYREDFVGDQNVATNVRAEPGGGISAVAGNGFNFHFFPPNRAPIDPTDVAGMFVRCRARLIVDAGSTDDRSIARYLLGVGGDYWMSLTAAWDELKTNGDFAMGKMKVVRSDWRWFSAHTLDEARLRANPPPLR